TGQEFREARTAIANQGYKWLGTNKGDMGEALVQYARHMTDAVIQENPQFAPTLQAAGESYKMWMRMAGAARGATKGGKFDPADLLRAIKSQDPSTTGFARGDGVLQGYAQAAHVAMGGDKSTSLKDLVHIFSRHGLPSEVARGLVAPAGRAAKEASPY